MSMLAVVLVGSILGVASQCLWAADTASAGHKILYYTCPMHPSVKANQPGACPICGMHLGPVYGKPGGSVTNAPPTTTSTNTSLVTGAGCCGSGGCR